MRALNSNEIFVVNGGQVEWNTNPDGKLVPIWTVEGSPAQIIVDGAIVIAHLVNEYFNNKKRPVCENPKPPVCENK